MPITHRDLEGTVRDVLPSKADADDILARLRRRVEDVESAVLVFDNVHVELRPLGCAHTACHLSFPSSLGVHCDDCLFANLDGWADTSALNIEKKRVSGETPFMITNRLTLSFTHTFSMHSPQP